MIVEVDVVADGGSQRVIAVEFVPVIHVRFHRLEHRLHVRVVIHAARPIHAAQQPCAIECTREVIPQILHL